MSPGPVPVRESPQGQSRKCWRHNQPGRGKPVAIRPADNRETRDVPATGAGENPASVTRCPVKRLGMRPRGLGAAPYLLTGSEEGEKPFHTTKWLPLC